MGSQSDGNRLIGQVGEAINVFVSHNIWDDYFDCLTDSIFCGGTIHGVLNLGVSTVSTNGITDHVWRFGCSNE